MRRFPLIRFLLVLILLAVPLKVFAQEPLTETYSSPDGSFSFRYPADWFIDQQSMAFGLLLGNNASVMQNLEPRSGEVLVGILLPVGVRAFAADLVRQDRFIAPDVAQDMFEALFEEDADVRTKVGRDVTIGDYSGYRLTFRYKDDLGVTLLVLDLGDGNLMAIFAQYLAEERRDFEPTVLAVVESIMFEDTSGVVSSEEVPPLTQLYTSEDGTTQVSFPADWYRASLSDYTVFASSMAAVNQYATDGTLEPGQLFGAFLDAAQFKDTYQALDISPDTTPLDVAAWIKSRATTIHDDPVEIDPGGWPGAMLYSQSGTLDLWQMVIKVDTQDFMAFTFVAAQGTLAQYEPLMTAILASVSYNNPLVYSWRLLDSRTGRGMAFSPDGTLLAAADTSRIVHYWDVIGGSEVKSDVPITGIIQALAYNPDGELLIVSLQPGYSLILLNAATGQSHTLPLTEYTTSVAFNLNRTQLATVSDDQRIRVWDVDSGELISEMKTPFMVGIVNSGSSLFNPKSTLIIAGSAYNSRVELWETTTWEPIQTLSVQTGGPNSMAIHPNGTILAVGSVRDQNTVVLWNLVTGESIATLEGHIGQITALDFSPDGTLLASGSQDQTVRVWDVESRTQRAVITVHTDWIKDLGFSPDGTRLATLSGDNTVKLWDVARLLAP